jgi:hypothetical protein
MPDAETRSILESRSHRDDQALGTTPLSTILPNKRGGAYRPPKGLSGQQ